MMIDSAIRAEQRARKAYERAVSALFNAETESARKRHARRAQVASRHLRDAARDRARLSCDLDALSEYRRTA
jgi:hypothetical protein